MAFYSAAALAGIVLIVFLIAISFILPATPTAQNEPAPASSAAAPKQGIGSVLLHSGILPIFGAIIMCGILRDGIETWLPSLYGQAFSRDPGESTLVSVALPIFSVLSITLITALHKKSFFNNEIRGSAALFLLAALLALPLSILITVDATVTRFICLILAALICAAMHGINFLLISCLPGRFARFGRSSTVGGLVNAFVYIGAASATYGFALISEHAGWSATTLSWMAVGIAGALLALFGLRKYSVFIKTEK